MLYTWVPLGHFLNPSVQNIIEFIHSGLQDCLHPEDLSSSWNHFAVDHISVALKKQTHSIIVLIQRTQCGAEMVPLSSRPSIRLCPPTCWELFSWPLVRVVHNTAGFQTWLQAARLLVPLLQSSHASENSCNVNAINASHLSFLPL